MTIENNDWLLVNRGDQSYKIKYEKIKQDISDGISLDAPIDGNNMVVKTVIGKKLFPMVIQMQM